MATWASFPTDEALARPASVGFDLVEVAPNEKPPVCRIMDFGKFKYQQKKKHHKTHVHHTKIKEIRLRPKTGDHDIEFKVAPGPQLSVHKDKVVVSVVFRGREMAHIDEGQRVMKAIDQPNSKTSAKVESGPQQMGRRLTCTLAPDDDLARSRRSPDRDPLPSPSPIPCSSKSHTKEYPSCRSRRPTRARRSDFA